MAINTTTFESTLQTKLNDTTLAAKDMLLLGKALEATSGNIAVSNVTAEGTTQVARVVAAMTGALPDQSGQAGKVLTSDGTDSSWQEGLPSQTGQSAKFLTTDGTSANWEALSSSALSADFTVEAGKTVTTGEVVNFAAGKIGANPVVNTQSTIQVDTTYDTHQMNASGTIAVRAETNASGHHQVRTGVVNQTTGAITWNSETTLHTGDTNNDTTLVFVEDDKFYIYGKGGYTTGNTYIVCFSVNPATGSVTQSNTFTHNWTTDPRYNYSSPQVVIKGLSTPKFIFRMYNQHYNGGWQHWYDDYTFTWADSGSLTNNSSCDPVDASATRPDVGAYLVQSDTKLLQVRSETSWKLHDWNGSYTTNKTDITFDSSYASEERVYRISGEDKFVVLFKNTSNEIKLNTYTYASGSITKTNDHTVIASGAGVSLGSLVGSGNNIVIGYEDDSKGYVATFTLDSSTYAVNGTGLSVVQNTSNSAVQVGGPHSTNKYTAWFNTGSRVNSNVVTANAYATSALNWVGVASTTASGGATCPVVMDGIASGFSGLTQGSKYYYDTTTYDGSVTTALTNFLIGTAISTTEIKLNA
jgi:hypothetical protein